MKLYRRTGFFLITIIWLFGSIAQFLAAELPSSVILFPFLDVLYSPVCHQIGSKLFCIDDYCSFVCSRCLGIYIGFTISSFFILIRNPKTFYEIKYLVYSSVPMILDVILSTTRVYDYSESTALTSGFIFGCAAFYYFYKAIYNIFEKQISSKE